MSVLAKIVADVENFFKDTSTSAGKFAAAFVKLFKKAPTALQTVNNFIAQVAGLVTAAVALIDPAVSPAVADVFATMETALAAIQAAAASAVSGQSLLQALQNFQTEVPQLLSGLDIKNSALAKTLMLSPQNGFSSFILLWTAC